MHTGGCNIKGFKGDEAADEDEDEEEDDTDRIENDTGVFAVD